MVERRDIYYMVGILIHGIRKVTQLALTRKSRVEILVIQHYGGVFDAISDKSLNISRIIDLMI